jgi:hypothetical protein
MLLFAYFLVWVAILSRYAAQASPTGMSEVRDVLVQLADEEHCGHYTRARAHIHEASLQAGNVSLGEEPLGTALWRVQLALLRLKQSPEDCGTIGEALHRLARAHPILKSFSRDLESLVLSARAATEELYMDIEDAVREFARNMDTRRLQVNIGTGEKDRTVESHNRKETLEGYSVALGMCRPYIARYIRTWRPLLNAWEEMLVAAETWTREGDVCSAGEHFTIVDTFLFHMDLAFDARGMWGVI